VSAAVHHDTSPPLWLIPPVPRAQPRADYQPKRLPRPRPARPQADRALQAEVPPASAPVVLENFDGVGQGFSGPAGIFTVDAAPPDPNGDVGPNHYVETVNTDFAVFDKVGTPLFGPVPINTLWSGFGGDCETNNDGDPVVLYDPIADRWIISQLSVTGANGTSRPFLECVAVSQTPDPTGAYFRYSFAYTGLNDYPKLGVWPDAYYATFNLFDATGTFFTGAKVCAFDRARMLLGQPATQQCFKTSVFYSGLLPADLDGSRLPPAGAPNPVVALGALANQLAVWKFHTDWTTPANSTFTGPTILATAAFSDACQGGTCIPQAGTTQQLDSLGDRLMNRLAYRNFADGHQSLVANHSVTAGSSTGVRWYEIRLDAAGNPSLFQQGTYAPDANYRWMGSIAQDRDGDMALGFSVSGATIEPQIHFTGRHVYDPAGQMTQGEGTVIDGTGVQLPSLSRWGDYSMMAVDPSDDCTFWYTNQYIPTNGAFNWRTRVGTFRLPGCGTTPATPVITLEVNGQHPTPPVVTVGGPTLVTLDVSPTTYAVAVDWYWALRYNGTLYWVTSSSTLSTTPASFRHSPPVPVTNATLLNFTLPPASTITNVVFMLNGTTVVASDFVTATRP
ncbi:MAG: hypothetical protein ACHQNA_12045, partial [Acidimicrobiales bacterium]